MGRFIGGCHDDDDLKMFAQFYDPDKIATRHSSSFVGATSQGLVVIAWTGRKE